MFLPNPEIVDKALLSILSINAAIQDVRICAISFYRPLDHIQPRLEKLAEGIRKLEPDIVVLQELFHYRFQKQFYDRLADIYPHAAGFARRGPKLRLGNELITLSKYPLANSRFIRFRETALEESLFTNKGIYTMDIDIPAAGLFHLTNFHMTAGGLWNHPEDNNMEKIRASQIDQLIESVPDNIPAILAGDLNSGPSSSPGNYARMLSAGFIDTFVEAGAEGMSWDPSNPLVAHHSENHLPPQRVDHVFINPAAQDRIQPETARIVLDNRCVTLANGLEIPVSDHYGVLVEFRSS